MCEFSDGIASMYPGTLRFTIDFLVIGWEKDDCRTAIMIFLLEVEGIMHKNTFKKLHYIHWLMDPFPAYYLNDTNKTRLLVYIA